LNSSEGQEFAEDAEIPSFRQFWDSSVCGMVRLYQNGSKVQGLMLPGTAGFMEAHFGTEVVVTECPVLTSAAFESSKKRPAAAPSVAVCKRPAAKVAKKEEQEEQEGEEDEEEEDWDGEDWQASTDDPLVEEEEEEEEEEEGEEDEEEAEEEEKEKEKELEKEKEEEKEKEKEKDDGNLVAVGQKPKNEEILSSTWGRCRAEFYTSKSYIRYFVEGKPKLIMSCQAVNHWSVIQQLIPHAKKANMTVEAMKRIRDELQ
jgi:hypothetical protein